MNLEQYQAKRQELFLQAQQALEAGNIEEAKAKRQEIEKLDNDFEAIAKEKTNLKALEGKSTITDISKTAIPVGKLQKVDEVNFIDKNKATGQDELYKNAFAKSLMGQTLTDEETQAFTKTNDSFKAVTNTVEENSILVPKTVKNQIWKEISESHPILSDLEMTFIKGDVTIIKDDNTDADAEWEGEKDQQDGDEISFGQVDLKGCELPKTITISWKLKKMGIDAFLVYITNKLAEKIGNALAKAVVSGKGKPGKDDTFKAQPKGVRTALLAEEGIPQIVTYTEANGVVYKTLTSALAKIKSGYLQGAAVYAKNTDIWNVIANIVDAKGKPLFISDPTAEGVGRIFGIPVKEEDGATEGEILIGNVAKGYALNVNEDMTIYKEDHVKTRTTDYMGYSIVDGDVLTTKAFVLIKKS